MSKIGIYYGSTTGNTENVANALADAFGTSAQEIADASVEAFADYDVLIFGSSTWGSGDLQSDWEDFVENLEDGTLEGKKVAVFGTGDSSTYSDTFCNALAAIATAAVDAGATLIGNKVDASGYEFDESESVVDGAFVGLAIDEDNESDKTDARIAAWVEQLKAQI